MGKRILVVDDDPVIGVLVNEYLTAYGHNIEVQTTGERCLESLEDHLPDLVILDMIMPDMTGVDVLRSIRGNATMAKLPVIMLSANNDADSLLGDYEFNADAYIEKPFDIRVILEAIEKVAKGEVKP